MAAVASQEFRLLVAAGPNMHPPGRPSADSLITAPVEKLHDLPEPSCEGSLFGTFGCLAFLSTTRVASQYET